jgi:ATPase subunit of ABC transporter with duplicated ATPase domains
LLLTVSGLVTGYQYPIIGPVDFTLSAGEALGIVGPNGSGKSTLLKALYGEAQVFAGSITRAPGTDISCLPQQALRLAQVPLSVREYLRLMQADAEPLPARLAALTRNRIDTLSGGQYQLLAIWAALASGSRLVLLDEPTNNLDPDGTALLQEWLQARPANRGLLVISHDAAFMHAVCDRQLDVGGLSRRPVPATAPEATP